MNKELVDQFELLKNHYKNTNDKWRFVAYSKAVNILKNLNFKITKISDVDNTRGIGAKIKEKIQEFLSTGKIARAEEYKQEQKTSSILNELENIWGVGPVKAKKLLTLGIRSVSELKNRQELLTDQQRTGLKYYDDFQKKIPRNTITAMYVIIVCIIDKYFGEGSYMIDIAGSYRRKASQSGDIDCLISSSVFNLKQVVDLLIKNNVIVDVLSMRNEKMLGVSRCGNFFFRLDIEFIPKERYYFALLYFTGSQKHNIMMRSEAKKKGLLLNEHGLYRNNVSVLDNPKSEKEIFDALGLPYVKPENR